MSTLHKVFVYGTLKKGEPNHKCFSEKGFYRFLSEAKTVEKFPLIIGTKYNIPFLLYSPGKGHRVTGEVYEVDSLALESLDQLEDHPNYYVRGLYDVELHDSTKSKAWIYFIMKFNETLLSSKTFFDVYSSNGSHGLKYVERYLRDKNVSEWRNQF